MNYAVIKTGGKQYRVHEGSVIKVEQTGAKKDEKVTFSEVLFMHIDGNTTIGQPTIANGKITGTVQNISQGKKVQAAKYKAKSKYRRVKGYRHILSEIKIDPFGGSVKKTAKKEPVAEAESEKPAAKKARTRKK